MLPELMRSAEGVAYTDKQGTINYLVKLAYRYADTLLEFEETKPDDILNAKPEVPQLQRGPEGMILVPKRN